MTPQQKGAAKRKGIKAGHNLKHVHQPLRKKNTSVIVREMLNEGEAQYKAQKIDWPMWDWETDGAPHKGGVWTSIALERVKHMASNGQGQNIIAAKMGLIFRTWEGHIAANRNDNPLARAWQMGWAEHEQFWREMCKTMALGDSKGATIMAIFYAKSQFGWRDRQDVTINNNGGNIAYILPGGESREDYYAKLGITGPVNVDPPVRALIRDVTPKAIEKPKAEGPSNDSAAGPAA